MHSAAIWWSIADSCYTYHIGRGEELSEYKGNQDFSQLLRKYIERSGYTHKRLAEDAGLSILPHNPGVALCCGGLTKRWAERDCS